MDRIEKAIAKLTEKERVSVKSILQKLSQGELVGLDVKKLKGRGDIFRIRKSTLRIIYRIEKEEIFILAVERRNERTYKL
jgi:mRNA-degrading endonuclease RelE of RelBE toxin-antitoxin system